MHRNLLKAENGKGKDLKNKKEIIIKIKSLTKHSEEMKKQTIKLPLSSFTFTICCRHGLHQ